MFGVGAVAGRDPGRENISRKDLKH